MKRSRYTTLVLGSVTPFLLAACEPEPVQPAGVFETTAQCISAGYTEADCAKSDQEARTQHGAVAPKFASKEDCEAEFGAGKCDATPEQHAGGHNSFLPFYMGYMMGSNPRGGYTSQPVYRMYSGGTPSAFQTAGGQEVA